MLRVRISAELVEQVLVTGSEQRATRVLSGLPEGAKLDGARFDGEVVELDFLHPDHVGELTDVAVTVEKREPSGSEVERLGSIKTIRPEAGDVVVITYDGEMPDETKQAISEAWKQLGLPNKCVVLERGLRADVRRQPGDASVPFGWDSV